MGPKKITLPDTEEKAAVPPSPPSPKPIVLEEETPSPPAPNRKPRAIVVDETPSPIPTPSRTPRAISPSSIPPPPPTRPSRPKTKTDELLEKAKELDPDLDPFRLKGRVDTILVMDVMEILDWGERNLEPLRDTSQKKSEITSQISRIDAFGWLNRAKEASSKPPSLMDRFTAKPPSYYDSMLQKARSEMMSFAQTLQTMKNDFLREVGDLHLDALAMTLCWDEFDDLVTKQSAQDRARTLTMAHQTAAMLQTTIEQGLAQSAKAIQQIDSFLSVTMPNWKMTENV